MQHFKRYGCNADVPEANAASHTALVKAVKDLTQASVSQGVEVNIYAMPNFLGTLLQCPTSAVNVTEIHNMDDVCVLKRGYALWLSILPYRLLDICPCDVYIY